ncbi:MAG: oxygen-independent coproporphyrinogen III oxidase [Bacteroidota bacterium]
MASPTIDLLGKYNMPGPRYTSYPTVPHWNQDLLTSDHWSEEVQDAYAKHREEGISLYIHLPYCESLCTYCGCHTRITVNHFVEEPYIEAVLTEWAQYRALLGEPPLLRELHLGGGTPTFFSPENLGKLVNGILKTVDLHPEIEMSLEGHPASTSKEHLRVLAEIGFTRLSLGIQDFDAKVQKAINRKQSMAEIAQVITWARHLGFESINLDLLYGLPKQTEESLQHTLYKAYMLQPDRVAFYGYAHVPWLKPAQKSYEEWLPSPKERQRLYSLGKAYFTEQGYTEIGMDHFALPSDGLAVAAAEGTLHRNFMGYTTQPSRMLIGLGASSISDVWQGFAQNAKSVEAYLQRVQKGLLPVVRGHVHTEEELTLRRHILNLMCQYATEWHVPLRGVELDLLTGALGNLEQLEADGLIRWRKTGIEVTELGRPFVRNVCMAIDPHMQQVAATEKMFSKTV